MGATGAPAIGMPLVVVDHRGGEPVAARSGCSPWPGVSLARQRPSCSDRSRRPCAAALVPPGADVVFICLDPVVDADLGQPQASRPGRPWSAEARDSTTVLLENSGAAADARSVPGGQAGCRCRLGPPGPRTSWTAGSSARRLALNDTMAVDVAWTSDVRICVVPSRRPRGAGRAGGGCGPGRASRARWSRDYAHAARVVERRPTVREGVDLSRADIIVAGGRGMHGPRDAPTPRGPGGCARRRGRCVDADRRSRLGTPQRDRSARRAIASVRASTSHAGSPASSRTAWAWRSPG